MNSNLTLKLDRARWWALSNQPFYGSLAMGLRDELANPHGKTACTDGRRIMWSPEFLAGLTDEETRFVLLHETLHCAHGHFWRIPGDEAGQQAGDYAINGTLAKLAGVKMPKDGLLDPCWDGKAEEEIYSALKRAPKPDGEQDGEPKDGEGENSPDTGGCGGFSEPDENGEPQDAQGPADKPGDAGAGKVGAQSLKEEWEQKVIQAVQSARSCGKGDIPSDLARVLEKIATVQIDWRTELADFVKTQTGTRNDWSRSARRMATQPCVYPRKRADDMGLIVAVEDTSGSTTQFSAAFRATLRSAQAETGATIILIECDADIQRETRIAPDADWPEDCIGGGGTCFDAIPLRVAQLQDEGERVAGVILCTDLEGSEYDTDGVPTLWLCTNGNVAQTGRTVRIFP